MTGIQMSSTNSKAMIAGFALVATGGLVTLSGMAISGTAIFNAVRRWMIAQQEPPSAIMRRKLAQAKAAGQARATAWQNGMATSSRSH